MSEGLPVVTWEVKVKGQWVMLEITVHGNLQSDDLKVAQKIGKACPAGKPILLTGRCPWSLMAAVAVVVNAGASFVAGHQPADGGFWVVASKHGSITVGDFIPAQLWEEDLPPLKWRKM